MKIKYSIAIVLSLLFLNACSHTNEKTEKDNSKAKIVEVSDNQNTNKEVATTKTATKQDNANLKAKSENIFEGTFVDASALEMTYYYFFKDSTGKEFTFFYDPQETHLDLPVQFLGADLSVNKDLVGKSFKIKYKKIKREDDNTGEMTTFNIPLSIEKEN